MRPSATIYFDESGFTGNNLLNAEQSVFSYASIVSDHQEVTDLASSVISRYRINTGELKGSRLLKNSKGKKAVSQILSSLNGRMKVSVSNKKYALAGKFFEYIFEPALSANNSFLYGLNFHKFIANYLYLEFLTKRAGAEQIFEDFERLMRFGPSEGLDQIFSVNPDLGLSMLAASIRDFAVCNRDVIAAELDGYIGSGAGKWVLDLTTSALFSLLAQWGQEFEVITAICDESKPLAAEQDLFKSMIGRSERLFSALDGKDHPISFNLSGPIQLVDSKQHAGIQLADCVAAAFAYACNSENDDDCAREWRGYIESTVIYGSVFPDLDYVDLSKIEAQRNALLLMELRERSIQGVDLLEGLPQFVECMGKSLERYPPRI